MKFINIKILSILQTKFPKFGDLLLREQQIRKENVQAHGLPGMGKDVKPGSMAWKKLPNVRDFAIEISPWDWLLLLFGYKRRFPPQLHFWGWRNSPANRYINYMFKRVHKEVQLGLYQQAYKTIWILMRSTSYQAASFNFVARNWHRNMSLGQVEMHLRKLRQLIRTKATDINYSRVYLDEPNKVRPLGVPTLEWRVYLHMFNNLVVQWRLVSEGNNQHGYLPMRGVITAWEALLPKLKLPNIFEADFKAFFDNVTHFGIARELKNSLSFPDEGVSFLNSINKSLVKLPQVQRINEPHAQFAEIKRRFEWKSYIDLYGKNSMFNKESYGLFHGVPQGAPTSCSLATLALRPMIREIDCVLYADDGVYFPAEFKRAAKPLNRPDMGTSINRKKTAILKEEGKWIVDSFKFLGVRYYPSKDLMKTEDVLVLWTLSVILDCLLFPVPIFCIFAILLTYRDWGLKSPEVFEADTRKGAKLRFTSRESFLSYLYKARDILLSGSPGKNYFFKRPLEEWIIHNSNKWTKVKSPGKLLFNNKLTGWFLSRMQIDSWNIQQSANFHLTKVPFSWVSLRWDLYKEEHDLNVKLTVFTASSFAVNDLMSIIKDRPWRRGRKVKSRGKRRQ